MAETDAVELCSRALTLLGEEPIQSFEDGGTAALVAAANYHAVMDKALASHPWNFNRTIAALSRSAAYELPWAVFLSGWMVALPAVAVFYLYRHRWWFPGYVTSLLTFVLFVLYHLLIETLGVRQGWWTYLGVTGLPLGIQQTLLSALMNGLVSLGILAALLLTRRYSLSSLLMIVLPIPFALSLLVHGLLGAPLYTALLLQAQSWAGAIGLLGTIGLLVSGAHIVAGSLERPRDWRQTI